VINPTDARPGQSGGRYSPRVGHDTHTQQERIEMILKDGQDFTWESICEECYETFECSRYIPKRLIQQMEREGNDDCIHEYMGETSNEKVRICPKCRRGD